MSRHLKLNTHCKSRANTVQPVLCDPEELEVLLLEQGHGVADALREDRLEVGPKRRVRVPAGQVRLGRVRDGRARVPEHRRPLLDLLEEVLREERRVAVQSQARVSATVHHTTSTVQGQREQGAERRRRDVRSSVPNLHLRTRTRKPRERIKHALRPLLARQYQLALPALRVPRVVRLAGEREAPERDARVDDARPEHVRVRAREHARHHRARGRADGEDARWVDAPVRDCEARGGRDALRVSAAVVRERRVGGDVPAGAGMRLLMFVRAVMSNKAREGCKDGLTEEGKSTT